MKPHELTAGITDELLGPRCTVRQLGPPGLLPLEDSEPGQCVLCGYRSSYPDLIRTVLKNWPDRVSQRCADHMACIRRWSAA
jgi:hypothetical protein